MRDVSTIVTFRRNPTIVLLTPLVAIVALSVWLGLIGALIVVLVTAWATDPRRGVHLVVGNGWAR
jgi:hypothetical protein